MFSVFLISKKWFKCKGRWSILRMVVMMVVVVVRINKQVRSNKFLKYIKFSSILVFLFFIRELYSSKVKHCIIKVIDDCRNRTDSKTVAIMEKSSENLISSWQYYCKDGMLYSFKGVKKLQNCPDTTLEKIGKCASSFYKKFKENKGSRSLCRLEYCMWFSCILPSASVLAYALQLKCTFSQN